MNDMQSDKLLNRGILTVVGAQFFSALADNALFFALLEFFNRFNYPHYSTYVLQGSFIAFYIFLAPLVGVLADKRPKNRILMVGNGIKLLGVVLLFAHVNPFICYAIVGLGAALYSPAKFGILGELVTNRLLIKANGIVEGSTILAILLGAYLGGLVAESIGIYTAIAMVIGIYTLAVISNIFIPKIEPKQSSSIIFSTLLAEFISTLKKLFIDKKARFAILGTSLFWGAASTLRLLLNDWVRDVLGEGTQMVSILSAIVSIGIVFGAVIASFFINNKNLHRCLWAGFAMGICTVIFSFQSNLYIACFLLILIGALGGIFVIPLNALLQERGQQFEGTGKAVAAQNFSENLIMLIMMGLFGIFTYIALSPLYLMIGFGVFFCLSIGGLSYHVYKRKILL